MYTYPAGATGLDAAMPPWVQDGGLEAMDRAAEGPGSVRAGQGREMRSPASDWENLYRRAGPDKRAARRLQEPALKPLTGKTSPRSPGCAASRPRRPRIDLSIEDDSRVEVPSIS